MPFIKTIKPCFLYRIMLGLLICCLLVFQAFANVEESIELSESEDYASALSAFTLLADHGDAKAQYYLGLMHEL